MESSNRAGSDDAPESAAGQVVEAAHFSATRSIRTEAEALRCWPAPSTTS
ncbi:hypothetical protein SAMN04487843_104117 [Methylobacterium sp. ap11]|nr:hypothetical protein SAMN04487843_104117 [Methylobacterium sp. ap11]